MILWLTQIGHENFYTILCTTAFFTCLGFVPSNNDLLLVALGIWTSSKGSSDFKIYYLITICIILGEQLSFYIGYFLGNKLFKLKIIQKHITPSKLSYLDRLLKASDTKIMFAIRITPVMRPYFNAALGSLKLSPLKFSSYHIIFVLMHSFLLFFIPYKAGELPNFYKYLAAIIIILVWFWLIKRIQKSMIVGEAKANQI